MPKINRVRIVNFSYNNNRRHIIDELFDFYGGENALLSLANGGGKSVIVQAMLQPVLPKLTLFNRKFRDFFASKATPSYIMLEWKLDDEAGYLLTGIAVSNRTSHSPGEEDESFDIRYFTFVNAYSEGNAYDIKNIPVSDRSGNSVSIAKYHEFRKLLQKETGRNGSGLAVFDSAREDQSRYESKLGSYNISKDEWKELIVSINEAEHGVSEVFSECKTSRRVMEQWIIKYIEKVLNKSSDSGTTDHKKLEIMMGQVAQSLVDNEKYIREHRAIGEFKNELGALYESAKIVLTRLDEEEQLKKEILGGYRALKIEEDKLSAELGNTEKRLQQLDVELEDIAHEERSYEVYKYTQELGEIEVRLAEAAAEIDKQNERLAEVVFRRDLQRAAEKYGRILEKKKSIAEMQQRLDNATKDQEELLKKLNSIKFSLKLAYEDRIQSLCKENGEMESELKAVREGIQSNESEMKAGNRRINELNIELGGAERDIISFEAREKAVLQELKLKLVRNPLLCELDRQEVSNTEKMLSDVLIQGKQMLAERVEFAEKLKLIIDELKCSDAELNQKNTELRVEETSIDNRIESFEREREKVQEALRRIDIKEEFLYDKPFIAKEARLYLSDWENKVYALKMEISELEKQIHGIENGVSYLPAAFVTLLEKHNLPCYTGEKYLREIDDQARKRMLESNPMLPYALLVTDKEAEIIEGLIEGIELSQVVPVIRHNQRDNMMETEFDSVQFITSSKNIALDNGDLSSFIDTIINEKSKRILELEAANEVVERLNHDYQIILDFGWSEEEVLELQQEKNGVKARIEANNGDIQANQAHLSEAEEKLRTNIDKIEEAKDAVGAAEKRIGRFKEYLADDLIYMENIQKRSNIRLRINDVETSLKKLNNDIARYRDSEKELLSRKDEITRRLAKMKDKLIEVADAVVEDASMGDESDRALAAASCKPIAATDILELEGRLNACRREQNNEAAELEERINELQRGIKDDEKDIRMFKLETEEYKNIVYSESLEAELESWRSQLEKDLKGLENKKNNIRIEQGTLNGTLKNATAALKGRPAVPKEEIRGDFSRRSEDVLSERKRLNENKNRFHNEQMGLLRLKTTIENQIKDIEQYIVDAEIKEFADVKDSIESMLSEFIRCRVIVNESISTFKIASSQYIMNYSRSEEGTVTDAVKGLKSQLDLLDRTYDKYYYLTERMDYYFEQLSNILKIMESKIQQLENSRRDLTEHAFVEACRIYHEIPKISENSAVEIDGVRRKVLEIEYDKMTDEAEARKRMDFYIDDSLESITRLIKVNEDDNKLRREIEKYMATKELLNIVSSLENCRIKAYKVDLNEKNRGMMVWEDIIVKNSGGEKFIAYFSLLVALISYSRKQIKGYDEFKRREESKVLIMDNPFGPITSGHLLKPMFDIAQKYNTQLICLSDIKQGTVLNSFDLIYMIKIRQSMMQEDFIELEPIMQREMKQDEKLETASLYGKVEQVSLFEM